MHKPAKKPATLLAGNHCRKPNQKVSTDYCKTQKFYKKTELKNLEKLKFQWLKMNVFELKMTYKQQI